MFYIYRYYINIDTLRLKVDCEKLSQEKTEMQRHYVMVSGFYQFISVSLSCYLIN